MRYAITFCIALTGAVLMALFGLYDLAQLYHTVGKGINPAIAYPVMCILSMLYGGFTIFTIQLYEAEQESVLEDDLQWADLQASIPPK